MEEQLCFDFMLEPRHLPPGCRHVRMNESDGFVIDGQVRVCSPECANVWASKYGKIHSGESTVYGAGGAVISRTYQSGFSDH